MLEFNINKKSYNKFLIYLFIILITFIVRFYLFNDRNSWHDEWHSIYVSDPNISNTETFLRYYGDKGDYFLPEYAPPLYYFLLKFFFKMFGYIDDNGRWLSLIFGTMVIPLSMTLTKNIDDSKTYILVGFLTCFNLFLTWQSLEIRAHSMYVVNALLSIILFYKVLKNSSFINLTLYYLISLLLLSLWPMTGTIFFGKTLYLVKEFFIIKKKNLKILATFILIFVSYLFINFDYLTYNLARDYHYTSISKSFFYNYHFRSFFGSIILGGIFLFLFSFIFMKNLKNIVNTLKKEDVLIYIIISTYFLTLTYSFFKASIMSPKYVMFIVPLVLVWISIKIKNWNHLYAKSLLLITFIIFILNIDSSPIKRPPSKKVLNEFVNENINFIITPENDVFNNYLSTKKIIKRNETKILKVNEKLPIDADVFLFICLNNPLYAVGDKGLLSNDPDVEPECLNFNPDNKIYKEESFNNMKFQDFYIGKFNKISFN